MILTFLFLVLISIGAMGVKEKSFFLILTCGIFLVLFEWAIYFTYIYGSKIIAYLNQLESRSWLVLLILPLGLIMIESQNCREIAENSLFKIIYNVEILFLELFCQIFVIKITIEAAVKKRDVSCRENKCTGKLEERNFLTIISLISIQMLNYVSVIYFLSELNEKFLKDTNGNNVTKLVDIVYYVIMTYTSVGYGDIFPNTMLAKIMSCIIGLTGFIMSIYLVSHLIEKASRKCSGIC